MHSCADNPRVTNSVNSPASDPSPSPEHANYSANRLFASATEIYGSGLTNGKDYTITDPKDPAYCGCSYGTGLLAFNSGVKVSPNYITDLALGYTWIAGGTVIRPQIFVDNAFNKVYILKGAFFSGASAGRPRSVQVRVTISG